MKDVKSEDPAAPNPDPRSAKKRKESPNYEPLHLSDTELYVNKDTKPRSRGKAEVKGGGFRDLKPNQSQAGGAGAWQASNFKKSKKNKKAVAEQDTGLDYMNEQEQEVIHGNHFSFFCPKRFNRYPRFTIFFKRDQIAANNQYVSENTVSLSPQFLSYLMDKNEQPTQTSANMDINHASELPVDPDGVADLSQMQMSSQQDPLKVSA